jgi:hypothetical protein
MRRERAVHHHAETKLVDDQLKEIQWLQKEEEKVLSALRQKHTAESQALKTAETKEQEQILKLQERELEKTVARLAAEFDVFSKTESADDKK